MDDPISSSTVRDLESELLRLWNKLLRRSDLTIDDDFFESGGDSLLGTELLVEVERLTGDSLPPSILFETGTVRRFLEQLDHLETYTPSTALRVGGHGGRMFHFFHGDFEHGGLSVKRLAAMLGPDRPILAIAPHGLDGGEVPRSIEEMAAERLHLILEAQPEGPYILGGHCNGALVAFEVARLLIDSGRSVDLVVMIDPLIVAVRRSVQLLLAGLDGCKRAMGVEPELRQRSLELNWLKLADIEGRFRRVRMEGRIRRAVFNLKQGPARLWQKSWPQRLDSINRHFGLFRSSGEATRVEKPTSLKSKILDRKLIESLSRAMLSYRPSPLDVPVFYVALRYNGSAWRRVSSDLELIDIPGHHFSLSKPSVAAIMGRLRSRLEALDVLRGEPVTNSK
jgi:oxalate---CoA ligase